PLAFATYASNEDLPTSTCARLRREAHFPPEFLPVRGAHRPDRVRDDLQGPEGEEQPDRPGGKTATQRERKRREWHDLADERARGVHPRTRTCRGPEVGRVIDLEAGLWAL